jgi:hypothetical protein
MAGTDAATDDRTQTAGLQKEITLSETTNEIA